MYKRNVLNDIMPWIEREEVIVLTWARQVGKTTILRYLQTLLAKNNQVEFFNLEDFDILSLFDQNPKNLIKILEERNALWNTITYVIIDEIQYLKKPTNFLKYIYDEYKGRIKLIVSWSSAFYLNKKFKDSLAGRKKIFNIYPLSFDEFLIFKQEDALIKQLGKFKSLTNITQNKLLSYFDEYFIYGWYPKIVLEKNPAIKKDLLSDIVNSYLKKDILEVNIQYPQKFYELYKILCFQSGKLLNRHELANSLDISVPAIENYIKILQTTFHMYLVKPFGTNIRTETTKMPKAYIQDTGIRNYFEKNFNPLANRNDKWWLFETLVYGQLKNIFDIDDIFFWRTKFQQEVDFVIKSTKQAIEVKYDFDGKGISNLNTFSKNNKFEPIVISLLGKKTSISYFDIVQLDDTHLSYYENNTGYIDVNQPAEKVLAVLKNNVKKHKKIKKKTK